MVVEIFCIVDDFCHKLKQEQASQTLAHEVETRGRKSIFYVSEVFTILVLFQFFKYRTFKDFYTRHVQLYLRGEFPNLPSYTRFVEIQSKALFAMVAFFVQSGVSSRTDSYLLDSTPLPVCHIARAASHKVFEGFAKKGKTSTGWFFGLKLHLVTDVLGNPVSLVLTSGNVHDATSSVVQKLVHGLKGRIAGDRGYIGQDLFWTLYGQGLELITSVRSNMKNRLLTWTQKSLLRARKRIESTFHSLKDVFQIQHTRHRSPVNFLCNLFSGLIAFQLDRALHAKSIKT